MKGTNMKKTHALGCLSFILAFSSFLSCGQQGQFSQTNLSEHEIDQLKTKLGQIFLVDYHSSCGLLDQLRPGGIVYWGANIMPSYISGIQNDLANNPKFNLEQFYKERNIALQECAEQKGFPAMFLSTNHEGGTVHYFKQPSKVTDFGRPYSQCARGFEYVKKASQYQGDELFSLGFNMNLGPVADVLTTNNYTVVSQRVYYSPAILENDSKFQQKIDASNGCIQSALEGYHDAGIQSVMKHFPNHGATSTDSHLDFSIDPSSRNFIEQAHLAPYKKIIPVTGKYQSNFIMLSHVYYPELDIKWSAPLSKKIINDLLRNELGFEGVVMTDSMTMAAITKKWGGLIEPSLFAFMQGVDMLMIKDIATATKIRDRLLQVLANPQNVLEIALSPVACPENEANCTTENAYKFTYTYDQVYQRLNESYTRIVGKKVYMGLDSNFNFIEQLKAAKLANFYKHQAFKQTGIDEDLNDEQDPTLND